MSSKTVFLCLLTGAGLFFPVHGVLAGTMPAVVINELLWMGSSQSSSDEWLELHNTSSDAIDLSNWSLSKLSGGNETTMLVLPTGTTIVPDGYLVIARNAAESSRLSIVPDIVSSSVSLVNSKLQIKLYDSAGALMDTADDGSGSPLAGSYTSGSVWKSMERSPLGADGTVKESWHTASVSLGFDDATKEFGTPGSVNANQQPVIVWNSETTVKVNAPVQFDASESSDPEHDPLTFLWNFGDGTFAEGATPTKTFSAAGIYTVTLTVADGLLSSTESKAVTVQDAAADVPPPEQQTTEQGLSTTVPLATTEQALPITLRFSELLPNPKGVDTAGEFIEIENVGDEESDLAGWKLTVNSRSFVWKFTTLVPAHGLVLVPRTVSRLALPNSGTNTVQLLAPDGSMADQLSYSTPIPEAQSYGRTGSRWAWLSPTPGTANAETPSVPTQQRAEDYRAFTILLNELLPNPDGNDTDGEFIELKNAGTIPADLTHWVITDQRKTFAVPATTVLDAGESIAFFRPETKIALTNAGGAIYLLDPSGAIRNGVRYGKAAAGISWSRKSGNRWQWAMPTPAEDNDFTSALPASATKARTRQSRSMRTVDGVVTAGTDAVFTAGFVLYDGKEAFHVAGSSSLLPDVVEGDRIRATGKITHPSDETKLTVQNEEDIVLGGNSDVPQAVLFSKTLTPNMLTVLTGKVENKRGRTFALVSSIGSVRVSIPNSATDVPAITNNDELTITGIWKTSSSGPRLAPRSTEDIVRVEQPVVSTEQSVTSIPQEPRRSFFAPLTRALSWIRRHLWF